MNSLTLRTRSLVLAACLSCALPVFAQTTGGTSAGDTTTTSTRSERGFDWGWLGLLGLAGLMGHRRKHVAHDATMTRTTGGR